MEFSPAEDQDSVVILSCDGDPTIRDGDWLRLWNSVGIGIAHEVWVGRCGIVYENSGPGGMVHRNTIANVLSGRKVIHIVARTAAAELEVKVMLAEARLGIQWAGFYACQDFASEVAVGRPQSFQRDAMVALLLIAGGLVWLTKQEKPRRARS
jgi:hypothetical protein